MAITPTLALELTDEQLLTISAVTEVVDQYLIDNYKEGRTTIVRQALIYDLFKFESKVLKAFIKTYSDSGWTVVVYQNEKQGPWLNFSKTNPDAGLNEVYFGAREVLDTVGDLLDLESRQIVGRSFSFSTEADGYNYAWVAVPAILGTPIFVTNDVPGGFAFNTSFMIGETLYAIYRNLSYGVGLINVSVT